MIARTCHAMFDFFVRHPHPRARAASFLIAEASRPKFISAHAFMPGVYEPCMHNAMPQTATHICLLRAGCEVVDRRWRTESSWELMVERIDFKAKLNLRFEQLNSIKFSYECLVKGPTVNAC